MNVRIFSHGVYGYGALLIGGILEHFGASVHVDKTLKLPSEDSVMYGLSAHSLTDLLISNRLVRGLIGRRGIVVIGGSATLMPELVFYLLPTVDVVISGEGEEAVVKLMSWLHGTKKDYTALREINGIAFREAGKVVRTASPEPVSLEGRPLPKMPDDLRHQNIRGPAGFWGANIYLETHRGCCGNCTFCLVPRMFGTRVRSRPLHEVVNEVKAFKKAGVKRITLTGGTTSLYGSETGVTDARHFRALLQSISGIIGKGNLFAADLRVDQASSGVLDAIKRHTTGWVAFGLESGSERMLQRMKKGFGLDVVRDGINESKKHRLRIIGSFIIGYPGETREDFEATREIVQELKLDGYTVNIAEPIPGTPMFYLMARTKASKDPLFQMADKQINGLGKLTVAEYRALILQIDSYNTVHGTYPNKSKVKEMWMKTRRECSRIAEIVGVCRNFLCEQSELGT